MLAIKKEVLQQIKQSFGSGKVEQGFILGAGSHLEQLDYCYQIPAARMGMYYYSPDVNTANIKIKEWAKEEICFCGFIHSHVVYKKEFSEGDIEFAKKLLEAYKLPVLWFGLGVVTKDDVDIYFYALKKRDATEIDITSTSIRII